MTRKPGAPRGELTVHVGQGPAGGPAGALVIGIDPSSSAFGIAVASVPPTGTPFFPAVLLCIPEPSIPFEKRIALLVEHTKRFLGDVCRTSNLHPLSTTILVETPSGKVNARRHKGGGAGLSSYGLAVGTLLGTLKEGGFKIVEFREDGWGFGRDKRRDVARKHAAYQTISRVDRGNDAADAVAMVELWAVRSRGGKIG